MLQVSFCRLGRIRHSRLGAIVLQQPMLTKSNFMHGSLQAMGKLAVIPTIYPLVASLLVLLLVVGCTRPLPIQTVFAQNSDVVFAFDDRFTGPAFGYVRGKAKIHCQSISIDQAPLLMGQIKTLNGINYAEFRCMGQNVEGAQPTTLPQLSNAETRLLLSNQGSLPPDPLPQPLR